MIRRLQGVGNCLVRRREKFIGSAAFLAIVLLFPAIWLVTRDHLVFTGASASAEGSSDSIQSPALGQPSPPPPQPLDPVPVSHGKLASQSTRPPGWSPHTFTSAEPLAGSRAWDTNFLAGLRDRSTGDAVGFELLGGSRAR